MREAMKSAPRIDEEVAGMPVEAHGYIVTPIARVRGLVGAQENEQSSGRYGWAAIRPLKMTIQDRMGATSEVHLVDVEAQAHRGMLIGAAVVVVASLLVSVVTHRPDRSARPVRS